MVILNKFQQTIYMEKVVEVVAIEVKPLIQKHSNMMHGRFMVLNTITLKLFIKTAIPK